MTGKILFNFNTQQIVNQTNSPEEGKIYAITGLCAKGSCGRRACL